MTVQMRAVHEARAQQEDKGDTATSGRENYLSLEESGVASLNGWLWIPWTWFSSIAKWEQ